MHVKPKPVGSFRIRDRNIKAKPHHLELKNLQLRGPLLPGFQGSVCSVLRIQVLLGLGAGYPSNPSANLFWQSCLFKPLGVSKVCDCVTVHVYYYIDHVYV